MTLSHSEAKGAIKLQKKTLLLLSRLFQGFTVCCHFGHKGINMASSNAQWCLNDAHLVVRGSKCDKKIPPHSITPLPPAAWTMDARHQRQQPCHVQSHLNQISFAFKMINSRISFVVNFIMTVVEWVLKIIFKWSETNHMTMKQSVTFIST